MRRHAKASSARSTQRQASGLGRFFGGNRATRGASNEARGSGALSGGRSVGAIAALLAIVALALVPAFASAITTHPVTGFSPINGSGTGVTFNFPSGIAVDESNGNVFVNDGFPNEAVDIFNAEGGVPAGVASPYQIIGFNFSSNPSGVAVDNSATSPSKGALYVTRVGSPLYQVGKFVRNAGTQLYEPAGTLTPTSGPAIEYPMGVAVDSKGNVFVADFSNASVIEFSPTGTQLGRINTEPALGRPSALALDAAGDLFVQSYNDGSVHKYPANGSGEIEETVHTQVVPSGATGVAVDTATNSLYVALGNHVKQYDATTLAQQLEFGAGKFSKTKRIAVNAATGNIYVVDEGNFVPGVGSKQSVVVFGPIATVPDVSAGAVTALSGTAATLNGVVNPDGVAVTSCKFEYGTDDSYGSSAPCVGAIPTDSANHPVTASLSGLDIHTTYHWRLVASNANGANETTDQSFTTQGPVIKEEWTNDVAATEATVKAKVNPGVDGLATTYHVEYGTDTSYGQSTAEKNAGADEADHTVAETLTDLSAGMTYHWRVVATNAAGTEAGPDRSFIADSPPSGETNCPNQQFRSGASANLPDCRAYEMVSPVDKKGGSIFTKGQSLYAFWAALNQSSVSGDKFTYSSYRAFGDSPSAVQSSQYLATRGADGWGNHGISPLHTAPYATLGNLFFENEYKLFSLDLSAGVFMYNDKFLQLTADSTPAEVPTIYRRDLGDGEYAPLISADTGLLPHGAEEPYPEPQAHSADAKHIAFAAGYAPLTPNASTAGNPQTYEWSNGKLHLISVLPNGTASTSETEAGFGNDEGRGEPRYGNVVHAVSEDGSRVFWTDWSSGPQIYLRENAQAEQSTSGCEAGKACTVKVSGSVFASFVAADPNGTRAIYRESGGLWEYDVATETRSLVAPEYGGMVGASEDLSRIYLVSRADLAAGGSAGALNLYLAEEGIFTLIATLAEADNVGLNSFTQAPSSHTGRVTPDGRQMAFMSTKSLPTVNFPAGYDNTDSATGAADSEVYLYDAESGELTCASCRPSGARPSGGRAITYGANALATEPPISAAWITPWSMQYYGQRALSDDGDRLFFNAYDAILPQDTNGKQDVYQWEAQGSGTCEKAGGCLGLISTGKSSENSEFFDASASGDDVFIRTLSSLLPQDNGLVDVYDARVNGGFPQPTKIAACEGETCQSTPAGLNDPTPASSAYKGPGNVVEKPARKKKKHHKAKKKQHKKQSRAANNSRRAHR